MNTTPVFVALAILGAVIGFFLYDRKNQSKQAESGHTLRLHIPAHTNLEQRRQSERQPDGEMEAFPMLEPMINVTIDHQHANTSPVEEYATLSTPVLVEDRQRQAAAAELRNAKKAKVIKKARNKKETTLTQASRENVAYRQLDENAELRACN